jgi:hypothetical protein
MGSIRMAEANQYAEASVFSTESPVRETEDGGHRRVAHLPLWIVQGLLARIFLFAGGMKLALPLDVLTTQFPLPGWFVRFIGLAEVLGALGLILPGLLRVRQGLTPLAAAGLIVIMTGATIITFASGQIVSALVALIVGILAAFFACSRWTTVRTLF